MSANGDQITPPTGLPARKMLEAHERSIDELQVSVEALRLAVEALQTMVGGIMSELGELARRVDELGKDVRHAMRLASTPPPPPMRAELPSTVSPEVFREQLRTVAKFGEHSPTTSAEVEVERYLERVELVRRGRIFNKALWLLTSAMFGAIVAELLRLLTHH